MASTLRARATQLFPVLLALSAAIFLYHVVKDSDEELFVNPVHFFEDAYMFLRYAKIWHLGYGESWNIGDGAVYGNTSQLHFLFVVLLTGIKSLTDDQVIKLSSFVPAVVFMAWLPWFCARHSLFFAAHPLWQRYVLWLGLICPLVYQVTPFGYHDLTGMDTSLSILLNLWLIDAVLVYGKTRSRRMLVVIVLLAELCWLARPENLLAAILLVFLVFRFWLHDLRGLRDCLLGIALLVLCDSVAKYAYFGDVLPLAFYAKHAGYIRGNIGAGYSHPLYYFFEFLLSILPFVLVLAFAGSKQNLKPTLCLLLPAVATLCYFFTMMTVMNMHARYFYPFTVYFIAAALISMTPEVFTSMSVARKFAFVPVYALFYIALTIADQHRGDIVNRLIGDVAACDDHLKTPAENFGGVGYRIDTEGFDHLVNTLRGDAPDITVAMTETGYVGAKLPELHIIDMTGLHNPYLAKHGFSAAWMLAQQPDVIWMPHWHYTCMTHDILASDAFWQHYQFYPGLLSWGVALRKDGRHYATLYRKLDEEVLASYPGYPLSRFEKTRN